MWKCASLGRSKADLWWAAMEGPGGQAGCSPLFVALAPKLLARIWLYCGLLLDRCANSRELTLVVALSVCLCSLSACVAVTCRRCVVNRTTHGRALFSPQQTGRYQCRAQAAQHAPPPALGTEGACAIAAFIVWPAGGWPAVLRRQLFACPTYMLTPRLRLVCVFSLVRLTTRATPCPP